MKRWQRHRDAKVVDAILSCVNKTRYCQREVVKQSALGKICLLEPSGQHREGSTLLQELHSREPQ